MVKKAPRTKQQHKAGLSKRTKALRAQGYSDISSYFDANDGDSELSDMEGLETISGEEGEVEINEQAQRLENLREEEEEGTDEGVDISYQSRSVQSFPSFKAIGLERHTPISDQSGASEAHTTIQPSAPTLIPTSESPAQSITSGQPIEEDVSQIEAEASAESSEDNNINQAVKSQQACHARPPLSSSSLILNGIKSLENIVEDKTLDLVFCGRLNSMLSMVRFYTSGKGTGWQESSLLAATSVGNGQSLARSLHGWVWDFLEDNQ